MRLSYFNVKVLLFKSFLIASLMISSYGYGQERLVLPGQELLYPNLTDPSFNGEERRTQITAMGQFVDFNTERASHYINAQLPIYENLSFGLDYFKNKLDFYDYSQVMLSAAFEIPIGENDHIKIGLAGGGESLKLDRLPNNLQSGNVVPNINENNIEFSYRAGLHYSGKNITIGGSYISLPAQQVTMLQDEEDLLNYELVDGYTAYLGYRVRVGQRFAVTPMFRYLSFTDDAIYEGSLKFELKDKLDFSMAYRNDYSLNPAMRLHFFKSFAIGYSYEKVIGNLIFDDIHSFSLSYKFNKANAEDEPEWMETAKKNIEKTDAIEEPKPKKDKADEEKAITEEVTPEKAAVKTETPAVENKPAVEEEKTVPQEPIATEKVRSQQPVTKAVTIVMSSRYYVVANSFDGYIAANRFKEELKKNGFNALVGVVEGDEKFYVFIDSDSDEANANKLLTDYKKTGILSGSYLFKAD